MREQKRQGHVVLLSPFPPPSLVLCASAPRPIASIAVWAAEYFALGRRHALLLWKPGRLIEPSRRACLHDFLTFRSRRRLSLPSLHRLDRRNSTCMRRPKHSSLACRYDRSAEKKRRARPDWRAPSSPRVIVVLVAKKCGTSALYYSLCQHPNMACVAYVKVGRGAVVSL